ncbi:hypothetical protein MNBD_GAMMA12-1843 [hydrothermal vent metagenome]|uniref:ABC transporter domain-containing protein n=1 Tax=hydrothermal vent metagenome TaxID=652676 RepID=A0A3B0YHF7_9ZZZZ
MKYSQKNPPHYPLYQASGINLMRQKRQVLYDVSIAIQSGQVTGLIGPNSAGKSSLLEVLTGFLTPQTGTVALKEKEVARWSSTELAKVVAYMPQENLAHWPVSVYDYVALGRIPHLGFEQKANAQGQAFIELALQKVDVAHLRYRPVTELSGGELSRVCLARVLAVDAEVILADEPIAGLDPGQQLSIMQVLQQEAKAGKAVVAVVHDLAIAGRFCDSLWLMNKGKIVCSGAPDDVLSKQNLREVYHINIKEIATQPRVVMPWSLCDKQDTVIPLSKPDV